MKRESAEAKAREEAQVTIARLHADLSATQALVLQRDREIDRLTIECEELTEQLQSAKMRETANSVDGINYRDALRTVNAIALDCGKSQITNSYFALGQIFQISSIAGVNNLKHFLVNTLGKKS